MTRSSRGEDASEAGRDGTNTSRPDGSISLARVLVSLGSLRAGASSTATGVGAGIASAGGRASGVLSVAAGANGSSSVEAEAAFEAFERLFAVVERVVVRVVRVRFGFCAAESAPRDLEAFSMMMLKKGANNPPPPRAPVSAKEARTPPMRLLGAAENRGFHRYR